MRTYLGISPQGPTVFRNIRKDDTGEPLLLMDENAVTKLRINFADWLEGTETIASATASAESCTVSPTLTTPNYDLTISAAQYEGRITIVATSSTGEAWRGIIKVRRTERYMDETSRRDYQ